MSDGSGVQGMDRAGEENADLIYIWKIPVDRKYVKSLTGILKFVIAIISFIAFACAASGRSDNCDDSYSSTYNWFEFVSISLFLSIVALWFIFALTIHTKLCFKLVPWKIAELIYLAVYTLFMLIAFCTMVAHSCGKGSNKAAAAFAFFTLAGLGAHIYLSFRAWREERNARPQSSTTTSNAPQYDPDRNMDDVKY